MNDNVAISIQHVSKEYRLGAIGGRTLNAELQSWWARKRGREDPNLKIGQGYADYGKKFLALDDINVEIKKGEAVGIIGSNGAGKSTLLKILSRVTAPTSGDVWLDGRVASMLEVGTGFHAELTGRENIYMNGAILGMTKKEIDSKIEDIIDFSECREFIDTPVKRYSSGMYVKLAFAVASHLDAEIIIMDEVLAVGDMKFQKKCLGRMGDASQQEGKTVLYVSHNMATIRNLCTRCIVLDHGKLIYDGDVEEAINVYSNISADLSKVIFNENDLAWPQKNQLLGVKAKICGLRLINKSTPIYDNSEKLALGIDIETNEKIGNAFIGLQLYSADQTTLGFGAKKVYYEGEKAKFSNGLSLNLSFLADGRYCFRINLFLIDALNQYQESIDQTNYIFFDVSSKDHKIVWRKDWWNNICLSEFLEEDYLYENSNMG